LKCNQYGYISFASSGEISVVLVMGHIRHPRIDLWLGIAGFLAELAEETYGSLARRRHVKRGGGARPARHPLWDSLAALLKAELKAYGAKAQLARHLGVPRQRLTDFLVSGSRLPDAEITLQLLAWVGERRRPQFKKV
jgi:hypothetical protein